MMPLKLLDLLSVSRTSTQCSKCGLLLRPYSSKSDSREGSNTESKSRASDEPENRFNETGEFQYPELRTKRSDYLKPCSYYFKDDMKKAFKMSHDITDRHNFPYSVEFLVIGSGPVGSAFAYWVSKLFGSKTPILVIDNKLTVNRPSNSEEALKASLQSSICTLKQEYELKEHVELSRFGAEFLRNMDVYSDDLDKFPAIPFQPFGFLTLANNKNSDKVKEIHRNCLLRKGRNEILTSYQLNQRYPWLKTDDIELALHGLKNEGWFDPEIFLLKLRSYALRYSTYFIEAELIEFIYGDADEEVEVPGFKRLAYRPCNAAYLKLSNGEIRKVNFATCLITPDYDAGAFTKEMLFLDKKFPGMHGFEFPLALRKRHIFCFISPEGGPGLSSPLIVDPTGLFIKRYGPLNEYICGFSPLMDEELMKENLTERELFESKVWPLLAARIPLFETLHFKSSISYYEDFNVFDGNPIIGFHPAYHNFLFSVGLSNRCWQHAAGIGLSLTEIYKHGCYNSIDLTRLNFNRIIHELPLIDSCAI